MRDKYAILNQCQSLARYLAPPCHSVRQMGVMQKSHELPHCDMQTMQPIMLSVSNKLFTLSVIMLNVIMLCVAMLRVVAPKVIAIWILSIIATHYTIRYRQKNCGITNLSNTCWFLKKRNFHLVTVFPTNTCLSLLQSCKYFI
jgi:hypothetical protein